MARVERGPYDVPYGEIPEGYEAGLGENEVYIFEDGIVETLANPSTIQLTVGFPSDAFDIVNPVKPVIDIPASDVELAKLSFSVETAARAGTLKEPLLTRLLYGLSELISETLVEEWKTFGVIIGENNQLITPLTLFRANPVQIEIDVHDGNHEESQIIKTAMLIVYNLRVSCIPETRENYFTLLRDKMNIQLDQIALQVPVPLVRGNQMYMNLLANQNLCKMLSVIDMFLCKFPKHRFATLRMGIHV